MNRHVVWPAEMPTALSEAFSAHHLPPPDDVTVTADGSFGVAWWRALAAHVVWPVTDEPHPAYLLVRIVRPPWQDCGYTLLTTESDDVNEIASAFALLRTRRESRR